MPHRLNELSRAKHLAQTLAHTMMDEWSAGPGAAEEGKGWGVSSRVTQQRRPEYVKRAFTGSDRDRN